MRQMFCHHSSQRSASTTSKSSLDQYQVRVKELEASLETERAEAKKNLKLVEEEVRGQPGVIQRPQGSYRIHRGHRKVTGVLQRSQRSQGSYTGHRGHWGHTEVTGVVQKSQRSQGSYKGHRGHTKVTGVIQRSQGSYRGHSDRKEVPEVAKGSPYVTLMDSFRVC